MYVSQAVNIPLYVNLKCISGPSGFAGGFVLFFSITDFWNFLFWRNISTTVQVLYVCTQQMKWLCVIDPLHLYTCMLQCSVDIITAIYFSARLDIHANIGGGTAGMIYALKTLKCIGTILKNRTSFSVYWLVILIYPAHSAQQELEIWSHGVDSTLKSISRK